MVACFRLFGQVYQALDTNPIGHFLAQDFLQTKLQSTSLEDSLIGLLAYLEPKLWLKKTFLTNIKKVSFVISEQASARHKSAAG